MTPHNSKNVYLIIVDDLLVAEDLRQTIVELIPDAQILAAADPDAALLALEVDTIVAAAIVETESQLFIGSPLADHLERIGTRIILCDSWDSSFAVEKAWAVLPTPFSADDVRAALVQPTPAA
jgi:hypothetical protein